MTTLYKTGTISIGAGSTSVTGSNTAWTTSGTRPGDLLIAGGAVAEIASVNSATGITLANGWPVATQAAVNYAILQLDDGLRALIAANTLLQALDGGTLTSLADLPGVANKLPYFSGEKVMSLTDFGAAARAFLAAGPVVTANALDATAGRLLKVGDFGLGNRGQNPTPAAYSSLGLASQFLGDGVTSDPSDKPQAGRAHAGLHIAVSETRWMQMLCQVAGGSDAAKLSFRRNYNGVVSTWQDIFSQGNILGPVSQSGGVPTGALIERGSNGNGHYARFADGTQLCWHAIDDTTNSWATAEGALFRRASALAWTYAALFAAPPVVMATAHIGNDWVAGCRPRGLPDTAAVLLMPWASAAPGSSTGKTIFATALGRWF